MRMVAASASREPLTTSLHAQAFMLVRNLDALLKAGWLPVEKAQRRVRASMKAPKGVP